MPTFLRRFLFLFLFVASTPLYIAFTQNAPQSGSTKSASEDRTRLADILHRLDVQRVEAADYVAQAKKLDAGQQLHARKLYTSAAALYNAYLDYVSSAIRLGKKTDLKKYSEEARDAADEFTSYVEEVAAPNSPGPPGAAAQKSNSTSPGHLVADTLIGSITNIIDWFGKRNTEKRNLFADEVLKHKWPPWEKDAETNHL